LQAAHMSSGTSEDRPSLEPQVIGPISACTANGRVVFTLDERAQNRRRT
jgi:hypothetical protein